MKAADPPNDRPASDRPASAGLWEKSGLALMALAVGHQLYALMVWVTGNHRLLYLGQRAPEGVDALDEAAMLWFLITGALLFLLGGLLDWGIRATGEPPPIWFSALVALMCGAFSFLMPLTGFWVGLALGLTLLHASLKRSRPAPNP